MADTFEQLGIAPELAEGAAAAGWEAPSGLQRDALPVIRRGNNVVLHASAGAGTTGAYGLGVLDRVLAAEDEEGSPRVLVLAATTDQASRIADTLARLAAGTHRTVGALAPGWADRPAHVLVAAASAAVGGIRDSSLKLDHLLALVVDGADQVADTGQWDALETVLEATPAAAQRVLVTGRIDAAVDGLMERHVRKAMTIPPRPADTREAPPEPGPMVRYVVAAEPDKTAALVALLTGSDASDVAVICRDPARADRLSAGLRARGLDTLVLPRLEADRRSTRAEVISYDIPFDAETLAELHGRGGTILVTPRQLAHLRRMGQRANATLQPVPSAAPRRTDAVEVVRARLRATARDTDLAADLALIEPLLEEFAAAELAAAALHMARQAAGSERAPATDASAASAAVDAGRARSAPSAPPPSTSWVRLFVSAGTRDGLGPGDLVGAITGETGLAGEAVGKIEVRESHSTVEVPGNAAESVIQALNGRSLRGRSLRVDYDRKERTQRPGGSRPGGARPGGAGPGGSRPGGPRAPGGRGGARPGGGKPGGRPGGSKPGGRGGPSRG
jgi:ATP-dependent RNA helicase DeaD